MSVSGLKRINVGYVRDETEQVLFGATSFRPTWFTSLLNDQGSSHS